ncbi:MAG: hypothetical protein HQL56_12300 [Magnetococcales bacterium]|nr:hypothetical protein [Magnetococcales bacterium]
MPWALLFSLVFFCPGFLPAEEGVPCRIGFDVGSSGIRVGFLEGPQTAKVSIDYLTDVWADDRIDVTVPATVEAFRRLPREAYLPTGCQAVAGGFSAWRLAAGQGDRRSLAATMAGIHRQSGVFLFVIPQEVEGHYGFVAAREAARGKLTTPFILDIGGGSLQIAGEARSWGVALGQKAWHKRLCARLKGSTEANCSLDPVGAGAMAKSREILSAELQSARESLGGGFALTAISAPVVKGMHPVLLYLARQGVLRGGVDAGGFERRALEEAIRRLEGEDSASLLRMLEACRGEAVAPVCSTMGVGSLLSDMLLVQALLEALRIERVEVMAIEVNNVAGLLRDGRLAAWTKHYGCYLQRLQRDGVEAYASDPGGCR